MKFLENLMKYGKSLNYKNLKNLIISSLPNNDINIKIEIFKAKLEKYSDDPKIYFKKSIEKIKKLFAQTMDIDYNIIINNLFNLLNTKIINNIKDENEKEILYDYLFTNISDKINKDDLLENYNKIHNQNIIKIIYDYSFFNNNQNKSILNLDLIEKIIFNITIKNDFQALNFYFDIYWKYLIYIKNKDIETVIDKFINDLIINKTFNKRSKDQKFNNNLYKIFFDNIWKLIEEDIKFFPNKISEYMIKTDELIKKLKINDLSLLKDIFGCVIGVIYVYI